MIGPTFSFDANEVHLPPTAFGFRSERRLTLNNFSTIPMNFKLKCCGNDGEDVHEIQISPRAGFIAEKSSIDIMVEFSPLSIGKTKCEIIVDVGVMGQDLFRLPIFVESLIPLVIYF